MKKLTFDIANTFFILIILEAILHFIVPIKQIVFYPYIYLGIVLFILGWIPNIWVWFIYRKIGNLIPSKEIPKKLITSGMFKFSRNPNYLGMIIALIGEAIFLGSLVSFIIPIVFAILIKKFNIDYEEYILEKKFGKKYINYKKQVRRWI